MAPRFAYVPELLPDELLYSFLGRLIAYNALRNPCEYLALLFGTRDVVPVVDLPTRLVALQQSLGAFSPFGSVDELIDQGTLYPYHRPFLTPERDAAIRRMLLSGGGKGLKTLIGRVANRFGANPPLRFCTQCVREDLAHHGVPYWHRHHQLPAVTCCVRHRLMLSAPPDETCLREKRRPALAPWDVDAVPFAKASDGQLDFAQLSVQLLDAGLPVQSARLRQRVYREAALRLGFRTRHDRVASGALAVALRQHFDDFVGFPHSDRLLSSSKTPLRWLTTLLDKPETAVHPICHLLLVSFLFGGIESFCETLRAAQMSAGIAAAFQPRRPGDDERPECGEALLKDASVSCRRAATLSQVSVNTVVQRRRRMGVPIAERRKHLFEDRIAAILADLSRGQPPASIATRHGVSLGTIYRLRAGTPGLAEACNETRDALRLRTHRRIWSEALAQHGSVGVKATRASAQAAYAWLYRHDRAWLLETTQPHRRTHPAIHWVDWQERDQALCERMAQHVYRLKQRSDRPRISKTLLLGLVGDAMVRRNAKRLPTLTALIEALTESQDAYRMFRIDRAIRELCAAEAPIALWRIQRLAGIPRLTPALRQYAETQMEALR